MDLSETVIDSLKAELLCIADSNWVLGHWYTICMLNGRELTDFTSMAGIAEDKLGHTRALFRFMEEYFELPEHQLEFGRHVGQVHSMQLLDSPPENWADFVLTLYLADAAIWRLCNTLREGAFTPITNMLTKFGEEVYFHQLCIDGWLKALTDAECEDLKAALPQRLPAAFGWLASDDDALLDAGIRTIGLTHAKTVLAETVMTKLAGMTSLSDDELSALMESGQADWDTRRRRPQGAELPPRLWEAIVPTSEEALIARRPLAISVDDNIDLFGKIRKDKTEPQF